VPGSLFLKELARVRREYAFGLVGYVVMPEHVHLLVSEPKKGTPSTVLQMLKQCVSGKMRQKKRSCGIVQDPPSQTEGGAPKTLQRRYLGHPPVEQLSVL
jgi:REP element-mobilizing transposase RayT